MTTPAQYHIHNVCGRKSIGITCDISKPTFVWMCAPIFVLILYQQLMHVALASLS